jgi:two-component system NtrC family sensor kinase
MTDTDLSWLRHELRTPINHILGYSQLMLEEAEQPSNDTGLTLSIERIGALGRQLLKQIDSMLAASDMTDPGLRVTELRNAFKPSLQELTGILKEVSLSCAQAQAADVEQLNRAAGRLLQFVETGSLQQSQPRPSQENGSAECSGTDHLLIVDDDRTNRDLLARILTRMNYRVSLAASGSQALSMLEKNHYDLMLLDILMPGLNGYQVLERVKNLRADVPVIVISALEGMNSVVRCIEMGAEDYFLKPIEPVLLRARIAATLDRKKFRERLVAQQRMASLGELTAGIAHEIKNPLNFVINFAELALETVQEFESNLVSTPEAAPASLADAKQLLAKIREHGMRADSIVKGMLLHYRGNGQEEAADFNQLVAQYLKFVDFSMDKSNVMTGVELTADYDCTVGAVRCTPQDIGRVVINLVTNAQHALKEKKLRSPQYTPKIEVRTRSLGPAIELAVRDNGDGVPAEIRDKIFNPFFTTRPAGVGAGLGLSIAYDIIVRAHHGELMLNSEMGRGAEFIARIPRR